MDWERQSGNAKDDALKEARMCVAHSKARGPSFGFGIHVMPEVAMSSEQTPEWATNH